MSESKEKQTVPVTDKKVTLTANDLGVPAISDVFNPKDDRGKIDHILQLIEDKEEEIRKAQNRLNKVKSEIDKANERIDVYNEVLKGEKGQTLINNIIKKLEAEKAEAKTEGKDLYIEFLDGLIIKYKELKEPEPEKEKEKEESTDKQ